VHPYAIVVPLKHPSTAIAVVQEGPHVNVLSQRRALRAAAVVVAAAATLVAAGPTPATGTERPTWVGSWATTLTLHSNNPASPTTVGFTDQSIRQIVHTSVGGDGLRIRLGNPFGDRPVAVGHATVALPAGPDGGQPDVKAGTIRELKFNGSTSTTLYRGAEVLSDPLAFAVPAASDLVITMYLPGPTGPSSWHWQARTTTYFYTGDTTQTVSGAGAVSTLTSWHFITGVDVLSRRSNSSVVVLGDSISDGFTATLSADHQWPAYLGARIVSTHPAHNDPGVLNLSLSGNRITHDAMETVNGVLTGANVNGDGALARLDKDVFGQTGVHTLIVELGINDLIGGDQADRIIAGLHELAVQAHERDVKVLFVTLMPFEGYATWTADLEAIRGQVNQWIRTTRDADAVLDFDRVLRDPAAPTKLRAEWDSGDHIHPNDAGFQAMANSVPLWLL
jgi:lysophospholipase L1-like esterase